MSSTESGWIVVPDDLDDAQSVLSVCPSDEIFFCSSNDDSNGRTLTDSLSARDISEQGRSSVASPDRERRGIAGAQSSLGYLFASIASVIQVGNRLESDGLRGLSLSNGCNLVVITDHRGCILPCLGKLASDQLRARGLVGSIYIPNLEMLMESQKSHQRRAWAQGIGGF